jgi:redox-sensitive bicupin YhaK (pirin superfamily)
MMPSAILRTTPLPISGPFPTPDPFLFCVYHVDDYPPDASGGKMEAPFPGNGSDFDPRSPYRMYHGETVPGFPAHPHRGFETITATLSGLIDHADSVGNSGRYGMGDVQWMTAGMGVVHGEMFPLVYSDRSNRLRLFQIWLNLPSRDKMASPGFAMFWSEDVPIWVSSGEGDDDDGGGATSGEGKVSVSVWAGDYFGLGNVQNSPPPNSWASDPENDVAILHITIRPGGRMILPKANRDGVNRSLYLIEGHGNGIVVDGEVIGERVCLEMDATVDVSIENLSSPSDGAAADRNDYDDDDGRRAEFLLLQGRPIGEPVAQHGPFVMNTRAEINDAIMDYRRTGFGGWPWARDDVVFPRDKGRFAVINGVETRPPPSKMDRKEDEL